MAKTRHHSILNYLRQVLGTAAGSGVSDADLLRRFVDQRDESAFELLLWRHAAMVLHVCRQVLGDADAAEDAFQATFLVFLRKAGSIRRREALGSWLYRVAYRIALKARARTKKSAAADAELEDIEAPTEADDAGQRELRRIVCEEVDRLPAKYRAPIVACFFEGKTHEEAAKQLGWPRGTVAGRLARARELLRRRLLRRGVAFTMSALLGALSVRTAQAALTGLVDSVLDMAKLLAAGQTAAAVVSPHVAALAEGVLQAMYWTKMKIAVVVLFLAGVAGTGVTLLATQGQKQKAAPKRTATPQLLRPPVAELAQARPAQVSASDEKDEPAEDPAPQDKSPQDAAKLAHDMVQSRHNLRTLVRAMHAYAEINGTLPPPAIYGKNGKALLSWRVALLPYLDQNNLYKLFHLDEPWNSPHNKKLLETYSPKIYAPVGKPAVAPVRTFYQVFVSADSSAHGQKPRAVGGTLPGMPGAPPGGMPGAPHRSQRRSTPRYRMPGAPPGGMPGAPGGLLPGGIRHPSTPTPAFVKGKATPYPVWFLDGTANTILIVEAGNPVPWTKPEDLHYAEDEPLPELGGLFTNIFHTAFADGSIYTLTKNYNENQMRLAITANDGLPFDLKKIEARSLRKPGAGGNRDSVEAWQRKNEELRKALELTRRQIRLLKEEQEIERELAGEDPRINKLKEEHVHMQTELKKLRAEIDALKKDIRQPRRDKE